MSENIPNFPDNAVQSKEFTIDSPLIQEQIKKNEKQGVTPEAVNKLVKQLEEFYKVHPSSLNLFDLSNLISSRLASDRDLYAVVEGVRGCQPKDSRVLMANGSWKEIQNVKLGDLILSPQKNGSLILAKVINLFKFKPKNIFEVCDSNNKILYRCSDNHKIPVLDKYLLDIEANNLFDLKKDFITFGFNKDVNGDYVKLKVHLRKKDPQIVYGFELDSPSHWYITDNYMITKNSGKSNLLLLLCLLMCRNAGFYRHRKTGHIVKVLPKRQMPINDAVWERLTVNFDFDFNLSFMDQVDTLQKKFNSLDRYHPFGIDEGSKNLHKQNWQSKVQFKLVLMSDAERYQNKAFFICIPNFKELNSVFRNDRIFIRIYIYVRNTTEDYASAIISMKDPSRWNIDPWFLEENMRLFEHILKNKPTAMRTPNDIIKAERKLKGFVGELNIPSLKTLAPKIWETYLKYKIENAKKEATENSDEANPDKEKIKELEFAINKLIRAARIKIHSLTGKQLTFQEISEITGLKSNAIREIVKDTSWLNEDESTAKVAINEKLKNVGL